MSKQSKNEALHNHWRKQIADWERSGQTQAAYCQAKQLNRHQFGYWRKKFPASSGATKTKNGSAFVPVILTKPSQQISDLTITLPSGVILRGITTDNLLLVRQLMDHLS